MITITNTATTTTTTTINDNKAFWALKTCKAALRVKVD